MLLAAGGSSRMGRPKQLLPCRGRTLLRHAAEVAAATGCRPVVVVLGADADRLRPELVGLPVEVVTNPDWGAGMGSSVRAGVTAPVHVARTFPLDRAADAHRALDGHYLGKLVLRPN